MQNKSYFSKNEICCAYMMAKDKDMQIAILADLNGTSTSKIISILKERGVYKAKEYSESDSIRRYTQLSEDRLTELYSLYSNRLKLIGKALEIKSKGGN